MVNVSFGRILAALFVGILLSACTPVALVDALTPRETYRDIRDVAYGASERQRLDVYLPLPQGATHVGTMPVVVFIYGGSWQNGDRADYRFVGEALASRGFMVIVPDYRTYPEVTFPAFVDDAALAVRWARRHASEYGADPAQLFLMGHSAGAQIVALLATDATYLRANGLRRCDIAGVIGLAGPYDFLPLKSDVLRRIFPASIRPASQPIHFVTGDEPPMFLGVADADGVVDPGNTLRFAQRLQAAGNAVEVRHYPVGHAMLIGAVSVPFRSAAPVLEDVVTYMNSFAGHASANRCRS
ncbi:alpha/beta hydrolase [Pandoraea anhela]|uniref:Carboxylesterase n=1 Tax=Pandoraea anhela TaxID=2508295 RepID=A0A5E4Y5V8_9BURK|nr:alpha/beta hydrolase [Pandoraea anhela]VVE43863.1 carboxylesterase [Pandoraea anhela]